MALMRAIKTMLYLLNNFAGYGRASFYFYTKKATVFPLTSKPFVSYGNRFLLTFPVKKKPADPITDENMGGYG